MSNGPASLFKRVFLVETSVKMTSVQGCGCFHWERPSVALSDSFLLPSDLGNKLFDQSIAPAIASATAPAILKYIKEDLQQILKTVLEVQALTTFKKR